MFGNLQCQLGNGGKRCLNLSRAGWTTCILRIFEATVFLMAQHQNILPLADKCIDSVTSLMECNESVCYECRNII